MKRVRNDDRGPLLAYGYELAAGESVEMTDEEAARLAADPHVQVTVRSARRPPQKPGAGDGEGRDPHHDEED